ncbi:uncharacterized protein V1518DRAFT_422395 [Limtongia smithiae]|uniref:uncharacterized protein n=1 Tax=Limtongia smithiae TaxID=1125753 RepID=UPI0034CD724F
MRHGVLRLPHAAFAVSGAAAESVASASSSVRCARARDNVAQGAQLRLAQAHARRRNNTAAKPVAARDLWIRERQLNAIFRRFIHLSRIALAEAAAAGDESRATRPLARQQAEKTAETAESHDEPPSNFVTGMVESILKYYGQEDVLQQQFVPTPPPPQDPAAELRKLLAASSLTRDEVVTAARQLFKSQAADFADVERLFYHMYKHDMISDIIKFALRAFEFGEAQEVVCNCILQQIRHPYTALANIVRECVRLGQVNFARHLLVEARTALSTNRDEFLRVLDDGFNKTNLLQFEEQFLGRAHLELQIEDIRNPEKLYALLHNKTARSMIVESETTAMITIRQLAGFDMFDDSVLDLFFDTKWTDFSAAISFMHEIASMAAESGLFTPAFAQRCVKGCVRSFADKLIRTDNSLDAFIDLTPMCNRASLLSVWSLLVTSKEGVIVAHKKVSEEKVIFWQYVTSDLVNAFLRRALAVGDETAFLRIVQTRMRPEVEAAVDPQLCTEMIRVMLTASLPKFTSMPGSQSGAQTAVARISGILRSLAENVKVCAVKSLFSWLRSGEGQLLDAEEDQLLFLTLDCIAEGKVPITANIWEQLCPLLLDCSEGLRVDLFSRYHDVIHRQQGSELFRAHIDMQRETGEYSSALVTAYSAFISRSGDKGSLVDEIRNTVLFMLRNNTVSEQEKQAGALVNLRELRILGNETWELTKAEVLEHRGLAVEEFVCAVAARQAQELPDSFYKWYIECMVEHRVFEPVIRLLEVRAKSGLTPATTQPSARKLLTPRLLRYIEQATLAAQRPDLTVIVVKHHTGLFSTLDPAVTERAMHAAYATLIEEAEERIVHKRRWSIKTVTDVFWLVKLLRIYASAGRVSNFGCVLMTAEMDAASERASALREQIASSLSVSVEDNIVDRKAFDRALGAFVVSTVRTRPPDVHNAWFNELRRLFRWHIAKLSIRAVKAQEAEGGPSAAEMTVLREALARVPWLKLKEMPWLSPTKVETVSSKTNSVTEVRLYEPGDTTVLQQQRINPSADQSYGVDITPIPWSRRMGMPWLPQLVDERVDDATTEETKLDDFGLYAVEYDNASGLLRVRRQESDGTFSIVEEQPQHCDTVAAKQPSTRNRGNVALSFANGQRDDTGARRRGTAFTFNDREERARRAALVASVISDLERVTHSTTVSTAASSTAALAHAIKEYESLYNALGDAVRASGLWHRNYNDLFKFSASWLWRYHYRRARKAQAGYTAEGAAAAAASATAVVMAEKAELSSRRLTLMPH